MARAAVVLDADHGGGAANNLNISAESLGAVEDDHEPMGSDNEAAYEFSSYNELQVRHQPFLGVCLAVWSGFRPGPSVLCTLICFNLIIHGEIQVGLRHSVERARIRSHAGLRDHVRRHKR